MLFSYLTPVMSKLFFPSDSPLVAEIEHFGVFAAGFIIRPIGGLVFGRLGDKIGRKNTLLASVLLMTFPMAIIAVLPTYEMLGWGAPVLLTLTRIFMGFSGEFFLARMRTWV
jgi:MHS family proline/betaine transporter-like MFS transporter